MMTATFANAQLKVGVCGLTSRCLILPQNTLTHSKWKAEERRRWRALVLHVKSKLEYVASGDAEFETEFLIHMVLPNGDSVASRVAPQVETILKGGRLPPLLPKK